MDEPSSQLLRHLGSQLQTHPWLVCTTRRPVAGGFVAAEGTPPLPAFTLRLEPLPEADAKTLIAAAAGDRSVGDDELDAIAVRGGGNPLFLQELAAAEESPEEPEELPMNVESLVAARIDRLAPPDRTLLRWASVLGASFAGSLIAEVLSDDPSAASDSEAWERLAEFVERDPDVPGAFRFRHALIRDAAYDGLSYRRRRELHGRVARTIERRAGTDADDVAELLSLHYSRAGADPEAWRHSVAAGRRAQAKWANVEAAEFYRRAAVRRAARARRTARRGGRDLGGARRLPSALRPLRRRRARVRDRTAPAAEGRPRAGRPAAEGGRAAGGDGQVLRRAPLVRPRAEGGGPRSPTRTARTHTGSASASRTRRCGFRQGLFDECIKQTRQVVDEALAVEDKETLAPAYLLLHRRARRSRLARPQGLPRAGAAVLRGARRPERAGGGADNLGIEAYYEGDWHEGARSLRAQPGTPRAPRRRPASSPGRRSTSARSSPTRGTSTRRSSCSATSIAPATRAGERRHGDGRPPATSAGRPRAPAGSTTRRAVRGGARARFARSTPASSSSRPRHGWPSSTCCAATARARR